jgi:hypothetical protein
MRAAPEEACKAARWVIARKKSRRVDIAKAIVWLPRLPIMIADHGEFRVNFIWDRHLVAEDGAAPQDCKSPQEWARRALSGVIRVGKQNGAPCAHAVPQEKMILPHRCYL